MKKALVIFCLGLLMADLSAQGLLGNRGSLLNRRGQSANGGAAQQSAAPGSGSLSKVSGTSRTSDPGASQVEVGGKSIEFNGAALDIVLVVYGSLVGKTVLKDPSCPSSPITLQPLKGQNLTDEEKMHAIETVLEMNGVHLEPFGDKFVRALPRSNVRKEGIPLLMDPDVELGESAKVVSMMLTFRNVALDEAQKALEGLKSDKGVLNVFERTSSILVTDTEMNINRMREIAKSIDVPTPVTENVFVRQVKNAAAQDIKTALEAIVLESQKELEKQGKQANQAQAALRPQPYAASRTLLGRPNANHPPPALNESLVTSVSDADRGMIRGKVLILSDERSNKLIIVTSKANMDFFDKVIEQLDVETTPDTVVKVYRLKYADAEDVSDMINDLIGNAASSKNSSRGNQNQNARNGTGANMTRSTPQVQAASKMPANQRTGEAKAGELSKENTTVLADKRINGLVVMTNKELVPVVEQIIESMDIKLAQVLIETVIIEVSLDDTIKTGIDWISGLKRNGNQALAGGGGTGKVTTGDAENGLKMASDAISMVPQSQGIGYFAHIKDLNLSAVISAAKSDSKSKYLASPVVMTVDNKEATIDATTKQQFISGWQSVSSSYSGSGMPAPTYTSSDIGIKLKVTPKINPNGTVMLEVEEEYTQVAGQQPMLVPSDKTYLTQQVDIPTTRKMSSDVLLEHKQTVVFGGLVETKTSEVDSGIPILKDIPWVGRYLFGSTESKESRTELLIFMTPYVLDDGIDAQNEAIRRKKVLSDSRAWDDGGWSASELADPVSAKELLRRQQDEWKKQDEDHALEQALEKAKLERAVELGRRAIAEEHERAEAEQKKSEAAPANAELLDRVSEEARQ